MPESQLRHLHDQISEAYFGPGRDQFARVAGLSRVLPGSIAGKLAERFLPPQLAARAAELLEPARARDLVGRVSVGYLADLAVALDPTRSRPVMAAVPPKRIAEVAAEMFRRGEYEAMAELAGAVPAKGLFAALAVAAAHDLLELVPLLDWDEVIEQVVDATPTPQLDGVLAEIAGGRRWSIGNCRDRSAQRRYRCAAPSCGWHRRRRPPSSDSVPPRTKGCSTRRPTGWCTMPASSAPPPSAPTSA